jgi:plasmid stability protein
MANINIPLDDDLHRRLRVAAAEQDISIADAVRAAIQAWAADRTEIHARLDAYVAARLAAGSAPATADLDRRKVEYFLRWVDTGRLPGGGRL